MSSPTNTSSAKKLPSNWLSLQACEEHLEVSKDGTLKGLTLQPSSSDEWNDATATRLDVCTPDPAIFDKRAWRLSARHCLPGGQFLRGKPSTAKYLIRLRTPNFESKCLQTHSQTASSMTDKLLAILALLCNRSPAGEELL